jgi:hypothetical protein
MEGQRGPNPGHKKCPLKGIFRQPIPVSGTLAIIAVWKLFHLSDVSKYQDKHNPDDFLFPNPDYS